MPKEFIDKYGLTGRPRLQQTKRTATIKSEPLSGGSSLGIKGSVIRFESLDNSSDLKIDLSKLHSLKIKIKKDNALALARWILSNYE